MAMMDTAPRQAAPSQRRANLKLALVLASVAAVFFIGFIAKIVLLGR